MSSGYEYTEIFKCIKSGKPYLAPIAWVGNARVPGRPGGGKEEYERQQRPIYSQCRCCPEKVSAEWIEAREKSNNKRK